MSFICIYLYIFLNFSLNVHVSHHKQYDMLYNKIQVVVLQLWGQLWIFTKLIMVVNMYSFSPFDRIQNRTLYHLLNSHFLFFAVSTSVILGLLLRFFN